MNKIQHLCRLRKRKIKPQPEFKVNEDLTREFREWYSNGGREQLEKAHRRTQKAIRELEKARKVDWQKLHEPMTI